MADILVPNFRESDDDDDKDKDASEKEKSTRKKRETNSKSTDSSKTDQNESESDVVTSPKSSKKNESKEIQNDNNAVDGEEEEEEILLKNNRKNKRNLVISSDDSSNDQIPSVKKEADKSSSDSDATTSKSDQSKKSKKRRRIKDLDENESNSNSDSDNSASQASNKQSKIKKPKKKVKKNLNSIISDSDSSVVELDAGEENENLDLSQTRHKLRNIKDDEKLAKETQDALNAEKERKKRLEEKRKLDSSFNKENEIYLNIDEETQEKSIKVDDVLAAVLKPHQTEGVKFMWDCCFESVKMIKDPKNKGSGCLLAHCMGLGKTLQVIALSHTVFAHRSLTKCNRILILMPVNVQLNWKAEFVQWTEKCKTKLKVYDFPAAKLTAKEMLKKRLDTLEDWFQKGGVFLMGYEIFSRLVHGKDIKLKKNQDRLTEYLIKPGPDLIVCDEGHLLKNSESQLAKAVNQIETKRRIVLTGTPLQNNLIEYHCMVSFVKPNLLGTAREFRNRFVNPITNGQCKDSTDSDVRLMKKRAHVLHNSLEGCVNRKDFSVMRKYLPPKNEYVLSIRLCEKQIALYNNYLVKQRGIESINSLGKVHGTQLFNDFQMLARVWTHPWILKLNDIRVQKNELKNEIKMAEKDFVVEDDEDDLDDDVICDDNDEDEKESKISTLSDVDDDCILEAGGNNEPTTSKKVTSQTKYKTRNSKIGVNGGGINDTESNSNDSNPKSPPEWWSDLITPECEFDINLSGKLVLLTKILAICREKGDKLVLFSQSIQSLNIIEKFLEHLTNEKKDKWTKNKDYFRLDGQVEIAKRKNCIKEFNDPKNRMGRLFIISTRAGGIGINLIGANRCIVFDASWNPSFDTQSIFRIYRLGQLKEVFIYRFLSQGTMEEKIYQRQVNKQSLAQRVIDEHQLDRHFTSSELKELYAFEPDTAESATFNMPNDDLLKRLLHEEKKWIVRYHDHESLLENKIDEGLSEEDRKAAWQEYEAERINPYANAAHNMNNYNNNYQMNNNIDELNPYLMNVMNGNMNHLTPAQQQQYLYQQQIALQQQIQFQRHQQFLQQNQNRNHPNNITPVINNVNVNNNNNTRPPNQNGTNYNNQNNVINRINSNNSGSINIRAPSSVAMPSPVNNQQQRPRVINSNPVGAAAAPPPPPSSSNQNGAILRNNIDLQNYSLAKNDTERINYLNIIKRNDPSMYQKLVTESRNNILKNGNGHGNPPQPQQPLPPKV